VLPDVDRSRRFTVGAEGQSPKGARDGESVVLSSFFLLRSAAFALRVAYD